MIKKIESRRKKNSFKKRITLWFSLALTILCIVMFVAVLLLYRYTEKLNIMENLALNTDDFANQIEEDKEQQKFLLSDTSDSTQDDLYFYLNGTFLAIYREDGKRCVGYFLSREEDKIPFEDYQLRESTIEEVECCVYDRKIQTVEGICWVRGVAYNAFEWSYILETIKNILYVVPIVLLLALAGGYVLTKRFMKPIRQITETAEEIRTSGNLAKRIEIRDNGDELAQLAETFNRMFERLQKNFESEREFTSNASHELRTPVAIIRAQCEYAIENVKDPDELWEVITAVQKQSYRMSRMLETLLVLTRIEQKSEYYPTCEENISEIVRMVCVEWQMKSEKNITLYSEIMPDIQRPLNGELLTLLINNLLQNAYRYGKENGNIYVKLTKEEEKAVIRVRDDGIGISQSDLSRIWERFYRADKSRSKKGLGLGLSLVKQIVEYYGGSVTVESTEGTGTEFCVRL